MKVVSTGIRICYIADSKSVHTKKWAEYFSNLGWDVHLISFDRPIPMAGVKHHFIEKVDVKSKVLRYLVNSLLLKRVKREIREIGPDLIHAHYALGYGTVAALSGFHPLVISAWGDDVLKTKGVFRMAVKYSLKKADLITCDGNSLKEGILKMGVDEGKVRIVFHGVDTEKFRPGEEADLTVVSTRLLEPSYDIETLIRAASIVVKEVPDTKFVIAGEGSEKRRLISLSEELGISDHVKFVGWLEQEELASLLSTSSVFVSTSLSDSTAVSMLEAMACGLPVVVTDVGDNRYWVRDGVNGFIVPIRDPQALARTLIRLLKDEELRRRMGEENRRIAVERADYRKEMEKMRRLYEMLLGM